MANGQMRIVILVPHQDKAEALKLTDTPGLLLEATISEFDKGIE